jgi:hypothetical protein
MFIDCREGAFGMCDRLARGFGSTARANIMRGAPVGMVTPDGIAPVGITPDGITPE